MAVLSAASRAVIAAHIQRPQQGLGPLAALTKTDLRAAVDATDDWIDANSAAFNTALPATARTALTQQQKTLLFCYVALRRAGLLRAEGE